MPDTRNLANHPGLVKSWDLEENLQLTLYLTSIITIFSIFFLISTDKNKSHPHQINMSLQLNKTIIEK